MVCEELTAILRSSSFGSRPSRGIAAYVAKPAAGELPNAGRGGPPVRPPPPGQTRYYAPYGTLNAGNGLPAIGPPWSELTAINLNEGSITWQVMLGVVPALAASRGEGALTWGSSGRKEVQAEYGGGKATGFNWLLEQNGLSRDRMAEVS